jgi:hypothetical protein
MCLACARPVHIEANRTDVLMRCEYLRCAVHCLSSPVRSGHLPTANWVVGNWWGKQARSTKHKIRSFWRRILARWLLRFPRRRFFLRLSHLRVRTARIEIKVRVGLQPVMLLGGRGRPSDPATSIHADSFEEFAQLRQGWQLSTQAEGRKLRLQFLPRSGSCLG